MPICRRRNWCARCWPPNTPGFRSGATSRKTSSACCVVVLPAVRARPDGSGVVDGSVPIRDLNRAMDWHLPDEEATTVAGLVIHEARSIPERGQSFTFHGFRFRVLRRERNRITALRIVAVPREAEVEEKKPKRAGTAF